MKVYAKDLKVGQLIIGKVITGYDEPFLTRNKSKEYREKLEILKITETTELFNDGRLTQIKAYILSFKDGDCKVNDRQKFELA
jgi:phosphoribosylformylglycinamidine (FGAM) synthase-like amidotransferase family enzyme